MKQLIALLGVLCLSLTANAKDYEEGKHYTKVQGVEVSGPEVREYFSFYCPACFQFEPVAKMIEDNLPDGVSFKKNHVDFLRVASPKMQQTLTKALAVANRLDSKEQFIAAIFKYIHIHRAVFTSEKDVRNVFVMAGVEGAQFDKLMQDETVIAEAEQMKNFQDELAKTHGIHGVPSVIVNGKYRIETKELDTTSFEAFKADYMALIAHTLALK